MSVDNAELSRHLVWGYFSKKLFLAQGLRNDHEILNINSVHVNIYRWAPQIFFFFLKLQYKWLSAF